MLMMHLQATQLSCKPVSAALQAMLQPLSPALLEWFGTRGIPGAVLERNGVRMQRRYMRALQREEDCIALPFRQQGEVVNIKYRALPKHFSQVQGGQQVFYGIDDLQVCHVTRGAGSVRVLGERGVKWGHWRTSRWQSMLLSWAWLAVLASLLQACVWT